MDSKVIQRVTPEQKEKVLDIPGFINTGDKESINDIDSAILNNIPGNTEIEERKYLNELGNVCKNWKVEEWLRVLRQAPYDLMCDEVKRRGLGYIEYRQALKDADDIMKKIDL